MPGNYNRDPRMRNQQAPSIRPEDIDALLARIRVLEDQCRTERQVLATVSACVTWMENKAENTLRLADELKEKVAARVTARPETRVRQIIVNV